MRAHVTNAGQELSIWGATGTRAAPLVTPSKAGWPESLLVLYYCESPMTTTSIHSMVKILNAPTSCLLLIRGTQEESSTLSHADTLWLRSLSLQSHNTPCGRLSSMLGPITCRWMEFCNRKGDPFLLIASKHRHKKNPELGLQVSLLYQCCPHWPTIALN